MKMIKKLFSIILVLVLVLSIVACKEKETSSYAYPSQTSAITNGNDAFLNVNNKFVVSNNQAYAYLVKNYGVEVLQKWLDTKLLASETFDEQGFTAYLNEQIYGTDTLNDYQKSEKLADFKTSMENKGLFTEEAWTEYYRLVYARRCYSLKLMLDNLAKYNNVMAEFETINVKKELTDNITVPVVGSVNGEVEISWSSNSSYLTVDGGTIKVTRGAFDSEATLTATAKLDDISVTCKYEVWVMAKDSNEATDSFAEKTVSEYYSEDLIKSYYESKYFEDMVAYVVTFDSTNEAIAELKNVGIDVTDIPNQKWSNDGTALTLSEVEEVFKQLLTNTGAQAASNTYKYDEIAAINSTLTTTLYGLTPVDKVEEGKETEAYTIYPVVYGTKAFLAFAVSRNDKVDMDDVKGEIIEDSIKNSVSTSLINYDLAVKQTGASLEIFDEGLETAYLNSLTNIVESAGATSIEYKRTKNVSNVNVASIKVNDQVVVLTADEFFAMLVKAYGAKASEQFLEQYIVLKHSTIINIETKAIINEEKYNEAFKNDATTIKNNLEDGEYAENGYAKNYGWNNFLRDQYGVLSEFDLVTRISSTIYTEALNNYKDAMVEGKHDEIYAGAETIFNEFFRLNQFTVSVYIDANHDFVIDKPTDGTILDSSLANKMVNMSLDDFWEEVKDEYEEFGETKANVEVARTKYLDKVEKAKSLLKLATKLVEGAFTHYTYEDVARDTVMEALQTETSLVAMYNKLITLYAIATNDDELFGEYKQAGLYLQTTSDASYTNSSTLTEAVKEMCKAEYDRFVNSQAFDGIDKMGKTLTPYVTFGEGDDAYIYIPTASERFFNNDRVTVIYVTNTVDHTKISKEVKEDEVTGKYVSYHALDFLTEENYQKYLLDSDDDDETSSGLTSTQKTVITTYYVAAINNIKDTYNKAIVTEVLDLLEGATLSVPAANIETLIQNVLE